MNGIRKILLVGGAGYLGSHLRDLLSRSYEVSYTSRRKEGNSIHLDLNDRKTFGNVVPQNYDCVLLLASSMQGLGTTELKDEYLQTNTSGLANLLQFISEHNAKSKVVYISSMTVYGSGNTVPVTEEGSLDPLSTYGLSKLLGETIFRFYCRSNHAKGVILRIPGIYGGNRMSGFIYNIGLKCLKNQPIQIDTSSLGYWETIHIMDLCSWIGEFIRNYDWVNDVDSFNIGYGRNTDIIDCAFSIKEILNSSSEISITGREGYKRFYLDNSKVNRYVNVIDRYMQSLTEYLDMITI